MDKYREVICRKQRFADSRAREACKHIGNILARLAKRHDVEGMKMALEGIVPVLPDVPIEPNQFSYPATILCDFAERGYRQWLERPSRLVPVVEEILGLITDIERDARSLVVGEAGANWDQWQRIQELRKRAYPLSYDLFSYLQGYWDEPANIEERLHNIRDRMLVDYWRLGIFDLPPSLTIIKEGAKPVIVQGVAAKVQALFRVLIRKLFELQAGQRPEMTVYIEPARNTEAQVVVQLVVPQQYREHIRQSYAARTLDTDPDWQLADHILDEYNGSLELLDGPEVPVGLQLTLSKAPGRKEYRGLIQEIVRDVCESPPPQGQETVSPRIRSGVQWAVRAKSLRATRLSELLWLLYDAVGLSAAKKLREPR